MVDVNDKKLDDWIEAMNKHKGEVTTPQVGGWPIVVGNTYNWQRVEYVTTDWIRAYVNAIGDTNPLWWFEDYASKTRWGGIIAPPTFTYTISICWYKSDREPLPEEFNLENLPAGHKNEFFGVFRPGDKIRTVDKWLGLEERKSRGPKPYRLLIDSTEKSYINQKNETVALVTFRFAQLITVKQPRGVGYSDFRGLEKEKHKFTDEELDAIYREYDENWRRGAQILWWEDVAVGEELRPLVVAPFCTWDSACQLAAMPGHTGGFNLWYEKMKVQGGPRERWARNPHTNANFYGGSVHLCEFDEGGSGRPGFGWNYTFEGLMSRMLCNWMGDDGFLKVLDMQSRELPLLGDAYWMKGNVTDKRTEGDEHLVDIQVRMENQDGVLVSRGSATVRLLART